MVGVPGIPEVGVLGVGVGKVGVLEVGVGVVGVLGAVSDVINGTVVSDVILG